MSRHPQLHARILRLGERIARLRNEARLSLRELADLTGVSYATIQKIESNAIVPSVATVMKIAQGLGRRVSFLLDEDEERPIVLVRRDDRVVTRVPASGLTIQDVGLSIRNGTLQATLLAMRPGGTSGREPLQHPGEEIKLCLRGRIEYRVGGAAYTLRAGDCLHFKSDVPHRWRNAGDGEALVLSVCTPPPFFTNIALSRTAGHRSPDGRDPAPARRPPLSARRTP